MDAFAENQMGRDSAVPPSPAVSRRAGRNSKEVGEYTSGIALVDEEENAPPDAVGLLGAEAVTVMESTPVDVPGMNLDESSSIAARFIRKQVTFMTVGDPYAEPDTSVPYANRVAQHYCTCNQLLSMLQRLFLYLFPVLGWLPKINMSSLRADVIAGLTVGVMLIPQSMSYANIAGLEYKYGLYTSVLPVITYALMGSSRQLGVGPVAMVSLLVEAGLDGLLTQEECPEFYAQFNSTSGFDPTEEYDPQYYLCPDQYAVLAFHTSLLVGVFQLGAGVLRLGFLVSFLAHPVISGFTSAAAIIIGLSQLQYFMGYKIPKSPHIHETLIHIFRNLPKTQLPQLGFGLAWWFMLFVARRLASHPKYKKKFGFLRPSAPLITCVLAILVGANLEYFNGCGFGPWSTTTAFFAQCNATVTNKLIVGWIPAGVTSMGSINLLDPSNFGRVLPTAVSCAIIGYMESIAIAKSLAAKHMYEVDPGQELISLGVANALGSLTSSYPVTGSFSRSAVNNQTGAQTQLAGLITGCLLLLTLIALTPLFYFLPKFALAAIVIASVTNLIDYKEAIHLWKVKKQDCALWFAAFLGTLLFGVVYGLMAAVSLSLALVIWESVRPQMSMLWRLPGTPIYRNIKQESQGQFVPGIVILRIGASMYFANVAFIRDYITKMLTDFSAAADHATTSSRTGHAALSNSPNGGANGANGVWIAPEPIRYIVIEMTPVASIDSTALHMLEDLHRDLKERGIRLAFSTLGTRVEDTFKRAGLHNKVGEAWIHASVHAAVQHCIRHRSGSAIGDVATASNSSKSPVVVSVDLESPQTPALPNASKPLPTRSAPTSATD